MPKNRLEAFSDGVIAIVITLLVLEIHVPPLGAHAGNQEILRALITLLPNFAAYIISFLVCAVWWVAHHNFVHDLSHADRILLWANNNFLLWLAFLPFPTALLGQYPTMPVAAVLYGFIGMLTGLSFWVMRWYASLKGRLLKSHIPEQEVHRRVRIGLLSPLAYLAGSICALWFPLFAMCIYAAIPLYFAVLSIRQKAGPAPENGVGS